MAKRPAAEQLAIRLYAGGKSMEEISRELEVSQTTLYKWKAESKTPGEAMDEWDKSRQKKEDRVSGAIRLYDDQKEWVDSLHPSERTSPVFDALSKAFAIAKTAHQLTEAIRKTALAEAAEAVTTAGKQSGLSVDTVETIRRQILGIGQ